MASHSDLLRVLATWHAFDPVPLPGQRTPLYVPFEELVGAQCESRLVAAIHDVRRAAVVGPIGSGKSSVIEFAVEECTTPLAVLWVSAAHEGANTLRDPTEFARHMIRQIVRWSREVGEMTPDQQHDELVASSLHYGARTDRSSRSVGVKLAAKWIEPSWSSEVERTLADPEIDRSKSDFIDSLDRLVEFIYARDRTPLIVIDDFDRWVNTSAEDPEPVLGAFFRDTCRMLAERNWGIALAIQPEYCASAAFRDASEQGFLNELVEVPRLETPGAIARIFDERIGRVVLSEDEVVRAEREGGDELSPAGITDVFEEGFEQYLFERYARDTNLRPVFTIADQALREAIASGEERITCAALADVAVALRV